MLSGPVFNRKLRLILSLHSGTRFPLVNRLESASQFERSFRDTVSARHAIWKWRPVLSVQTGTRFPLAWPLGKHLPDWRDVARRYVAQQPLQVHFVEPRRQRGLPDACRLQLFREHACRTDLVHGKADERMAVER